MSHFKKTCIPPHTYVYTHPCVMLNHLDSPLSDIDDSGEIRKQR